jgi:hypothetical protein
VRYGKQVVHQTLEPLVLCGMFHKPSF